VHAALLYRVRAIVSAHCRIRTLDKRQTTSKQTTMSSSRAIAVSEVFKLGRTPWRTFDPFLFCMYHRDSFPAAAPGTVAPDAKELRGRDIGSDFSYKDGWSMYHGDEAPGFPSHPHRGFETVTVTLKGHIDHCDSMGAAGRYGDGDTQWMTAGRGVQHSEMLPLLDATPGCRNDSEWFQLWLNLPARSKMCEPHFAMFWNEETPTVTQPGGVDVRVVAGAFPGASAPLPPPPHSWAAQSDADVAVWVVRIPAGATATLPRAASGRTNRALYMWGGNGTAVIRRDGADAAAAEEAGGETALTYYTGVKVDATQALAVTARDGPCELLVMQGAPIGEPVAQYGPFVMNSQQEIMQAFADYRRTQFGEWTWGRSDPTHPQDGGRFALYPDGTRRVPPPKK
jgi:redox-sensitive bicupin YhaK (pirin superfamily)